MASTVHLADEHGALILLEKEELRGSKKEETQRGKEDLGVLSAFDVAFVSS